ncbi:hypothetical protein [Microbulbifer rhizosphaerae]|uniref:Uncharacterized protein n=1 Tax=Microbulbifer rhizosphaerae TaxID=1562603 RepID=A0A7W4W8S5_9GAMM|nr:hypothetical protein [Microbulbifer rhizosphaerae]MBB3059776.1 hypothetical protein [Microbulbifer rhizosphaerae]
MLNPAQTKTIDVNSGELVTYEFTVKPVADEGKVWVIEDAGGNQIDDIVAVFKSIDGSGHGYGCAELKFTLEGVGWEWDWKACGWGYRLPGIQFCERPKHRRCFSEFQSYIGDENAQVLYVLLDPKHKEDGCRRKYKYCWVARYNGQKYKSADPAVEVEPE